jgi:hypothetical protein
LISALDFIPSSPANWKFNCESRYLKTLQTYVSRRRSPMWILSAAYRNIFNNWSRTKGSETRPSFIHQKRLRSPSTTIKVHRPYRWERERERKKLASEFIYTILTRNSFQCLDFHPKFHAMMQFLTLVKASNLSK